MIIVERKDEGTDKPKMVVTFDNGDLKAFEGVYEDWNFIDEPSMLRFMVAVMDIAKNHVVYVHGENGKQEAFAPADNLLKQSEEVVADGKSTKAN